LRRVGIAVANRNPKLSMGNDVLRVRLEEGPGAEKEMLSAVRRDRFPPPITRG
jgi:hypothetical protein